MDSVRRTLLLSVSVHHFLNYSETTSFSLGKRAQRKTDKYTEWFLSSVEDEYWVARIGVTRKGSFPSPHEQVLRLDYILPHPDYIHNAFINDIAILRLEKPVKFSDYIRPICLPDTEPKSGTICTVTGWGQLFEIGRNYRMYNSYTFNISFSCIIL